MAFTPEVESKMEASPCTESATNILCAKLPAANPNGDNDITSGTPIIGCKGEADGPSLARTNLPTFGRQGRRLARHQVYQNFESEERWLTRRLCTIGCEKLESLDVEEYRRYITNPLNPETLRTLMQLIHVRDAAEYDTARALILFEPTEEIDRAFPRVKSGASAAARKTIREAQIKELYRRYAHGADLFLRIVKGLESDSQKYMRMAKSEMWSELQKTAFGTDDPAQIAKNFSREERRGVRLVILNLIQNREAIVKAVSQVIPEIDFKGIHPLKAKHIDRLIGGYLPEDKDIHAELLPHALILYLTGANFEAASGEPSSTCGCLCTGKHLPLELQGRTILIRRGKDPLGVFQGSGIDVEAAAAQEPVYRALAKRRKHELSHAIFQAYNNDQELLTEDKLNEYLAQIEKFLKTTLERRGETTEILLHRQLSATIAAYFKNRARNEFIAYHTERERALVDYRQLGLQSFDACLITVKAWLGMRTDLSSEEKICIFDLYRKQYDRALDKFREFSHFVKELFSEPRSPLSFNQCLAFLHQTKVEQLPRLMRLLGVRKEDFYRRYRASVTLAGETYSKNREVILNLHLLNNREEEQGRADPSSRAALHDQLAQLTNGVEESELSGPNLTLIQEFKQFLPVLREGQSTAGMWKSAERLCQALAAQRTMLQVGTGRERLKLHFEFFIAHEPERLFSNDLACSLRLFGDTLTPIELNRLAENIKTKRLKLSRHEEKAGLGKLLHSLQKDVRALQAAHGQMFAADMEIGPQTVEYLRELFKQWQASGDIKTMEKAVALSPFENPLTKGTIREIEKANNYSALLHIVRKGTSSDSNEALCVLLKNIESIKGQDLGLQLAQLLSDRIVFAKELKLTRRQRSLSKELLSALGGNMEESAPSSLKRAGIFHAMRKFLSKFVLR